MRRQWSMSKSIVQVHIPGRHAVCSNVIPYTDIIVVFIGYTMDSSCTVPGTVLYSSSLLGQSLL